MANRYWVGGTASWDAIALLKWSLTSGGLGGEAVPTAGDDVYFDAASGAVTITLSGARTCLSFNSTGFTGTVAGTGTVTVSGNAIYGSSATFTNTGVWTFNATSGTQKITTSGVTLDFPITQNGAGGIVQLQDNLTMGSTRTFTLTAGTLDLTGNSGNWTLSTGLFASNNTNTRSIAFGTGNITVTGNAATVVNLAAALNFSYTGTPNFNGSYSGSTGTRTFLYATSSGNSSSTAPNFNVTAGTDTVFIGYANSINFTGFSGTFTNVANVVYGDLTFSSGMTAQAGTGAINFRRPSGTQNITTNGITLDFPLIFNGASTTFAFQDALTQGATRAFTITDGTVKLKAGATSTVGSFVTSGTTQKYLQSTTPGVQATLSKASGTVNVSYLTIQDINATGGAVWYSPVTQLNVDAGNNDGWDFFVQLGQYMYTRRKNKRLLIS